MKLRLIKRRHKLSIDNLHLVINEMVKLKIINLIIYKKLLFYLVQGAYHN